MDLSNEEIYTWQLYYKDTTSSIAATPFDQSELKGPYTLKIVHCEKYGGNGNYTFKFSLVDCPEGDLLSKLDLGVGHSVGLLFCALKGEEVVCVTYLHINGREVIENYVELYRRFWETRDRSKGYSAGMHTLTEKDIQDAKDLDLWY